jgi:hypothetical protein
MLYIKKRINLFIKIALLFGTILFSFPLWAESDNIVYLDQVSIDCDSAFCTETDCFYPEEKPTDKDIYIEKQVDWNKDKNLVLHTKGNIVFRKDGKVLNKRNGSIILKSGMIPGEKDEYNGTVKFEGSPSQIEMLGRGKVKIYYNPTKGEKKHKYYNPTTYSNKLPGLKLETYMLVNDVYDLQDITGCLYGSYALSQNIDASPTKEQNWGNGKGFFPIKDAKDGAPFSGIFDGNNHVIRNLYINRPEENNVGLFGDVTGVNEYRSVLKDFTVENAFIRGKYCVGVAIGQATGVEVSNVNVIKSEIRSDEDPGIIGGCVIVNTHKLISANNTVVYEKDVLKSKGDNKLFGVCVRCKGTGDDKKEPEKKAEKSPHGQI